MEMILRRSKTTGNVKSIIDYEPALYRDLDRIYNNNNNLSTSTVSVVDIPESAFESYEYGRIVKAEYIRDVLEKFE